MTLGKENYVDCRPPGICFETGPDYIGLTKAQIEAQFASGGGEDAPADDDDSSTPAAAEASEETPSSDSKRAKTE